MKPDRVAFVATDRLLSRSFAQALARQCAEVVCAPPCPPGTVNVRPRARDGTVAGPPIVVLVTWLDLLCEAPEPLARTLAARVRAIRESVAEIGRVTLCVVPYGSFSEGSHRTLEFLSARAGEPERRARPDGIERIASALAAAGGGCQVVFTPMVLAADVNEDAGHPSVAQKIVRVARCLTDEVTSKVPEYCSRFALTCRRTGVTHLNVSAVPQIASALLVCASEPAPRGRSAALHLDHAVPWPDFAAALQRGCGLRVSWTDNAAECNALDETFTDLVFSEQEVDSYATREVVPDDRVRRVPAGGLWEVVTGLGAASPQPWESSYVVVRSIDIEEVAELCGKTCETGSGESTVRRVAYRHGGVGPTVLVVTPFGIDPGYFTGIVRELLAGYELIMWEPSGNDTALVARDVSDALEILAAEEVHDFHVVTWCGGVRLAAKLAETCGPRLRAMALFAPELETDDSQIQGYRVFSRFFRQFDLRTVDIEQMAAKARDQWREPLREAPSANLDQYDARAALRKSPLQYHPRDFTSRVSEDLFGDAKRIVNMARTVVCRDDVKIVAETLVAHEGPILVISGTADGLIKYSGVKSRCERAGRWTLATVLGGSHYTLLEHGPAMGRLLRQFFRDGRIAAEPPDRVRGGRIRITRPRAEAAAESAEALVRVRSARTPLAGPATQPCQP